MNNYPLGEILSYFEIFRILLIAFAFCYLQFSFTGKQIFADFGCNWR